MSLALLLVILSCQVAYGVTYQTNKTIIRSASSRKGSPAIHLENIECAAHEEIIATDILHHKYKPYYVKLFRCQGADQTHAPTHRRCEPVKSQIKEVLVGMFLYDGTYKSISMLNHTKCEYVCKDDASSCTKYQKWNEDRCVCTCDYSTKAHCKKPMMWNDLTCCSCSMMDKDKCESGGLVVDPESCICVPLENTPTCKHENNTLSVYYVIIVASVEFIVVVVFCSLFFYYCCYKKKIGENRLVDDEEEVNTYVMDFKDNHDSSKKTLTQ